VVSVIRFRDETDALRYRQRHRYSLPQALGRDIARVHASPRSECRYVDHT